MSKVGYCVVEGKNSSTSDENKEDLEENSFDNAVSLLSRYMSMII